MSWGTELWDQYDQVCTHTDQGIEFVKRVTSYVEKRIHVEQSYAKDLRKLVKQFRKRDEEESKYTAVKAFSKLISETNDLAGQRELIAEYLQVDVMEPLKVLARDVAAERRKYLNEGAELLRQLRVSMETLERTKKQYEKASEEAENAQHALEKADNDPNSTKAKMDKLTGTLRNKETIAEECRNNYILQLEQTNAKRRQHYDTDMPQVFKNLQEMNGRRCSSYKELVASYADCHRKVFPVINTCLDNITEASNSVNPEQDNQRLIDNLKTGFPIPQDVAFEEYQGLQTKKVKKTPAKKKVEPREDYGHLPPEQRRKRLQAKVDELEAAINKALSDKTAMEKMQQIYSQNPQLGDANAVARSLEQNHSKMGDLNAELDKFKGWLAEAKEDISKKKLHVNTSQSTGPSPRFSPKFGRKADKKKAKLANSNSEEAAQQDPSPPPEMRGGGDEQGGGGGRGESEEWDTDTEEVAQTGLMLYNFEGQNEDELTVNANDKVEILEDLGDGWLKVRKDNEEGYVPESYVRIV